MYCPSAPSSILKPDAAFTWIAYHVRLTKTDPPCRCIGTCVNMYWYPLWHVAKLLRYELGGQQCTIIQIIGCQVSGKHVITEPILALLVIRDINGIVARDEKSILLCRCIQKMTQAVLVEQRHKLGCLETIKVFPLIKCQTGGNKCMRQLMYYA